MTPVESEAAVSEFLHLFNFLRDERAIFEQWHELVVQHGIHGIKAHDARLAAAMQRHGISQILTFNDGDFRRFNNVSILKPGDIVRTA